MNKIVSFLYVSVILKKIVRLQIFLPPSQSPNRSYDLDLCQIIFRNLN